MWQTSKVLRCIWPGQIKQNFISFSFLLEILILLIRFEGLQIQRKEGLNIIEKFHVLSEL